MEIGRGSPFLLFKKVFDDNLTPKITNFRIAQLLSRADAHATVHGLHGTNGYITLKVGTEATITT